MPNTDRIVKIRGERMAPQHPLAPGWQYRAHCVTCGTFPFAVASWHIPYLFKFASNHVKGWSSDAEH